MKITDESYLMTVMSYIHQNPVRAGLVSRMEDWQHSSYGNLIDLSSDAWQKNAVVNSKFDDRKAFKLFSEQILESVRNEFWI
jgi:hypothetical protein